MRQYSFESKNDSNGESIAITSAKSLEEAEKLFAKMKRLTIDKFKELYTVSEYKITNGDLNKFKVIGAKFSEIYNEIRYVDEKFKEYQRKIEELEREVDKLRMTELELYTKLSEKLNIPVNDVKREIIRKITKDDKK